MKDVAQVIQGSKGALGSAIGTTGIGLATVMEILPGLMGVVGTFGGIILTSVLTYKYVLEIRILRDKRREGKRRKEKGLPCRRCGEDGA